MSFFKRPPYRCQKLRDAAQGQVCVRCGKTQNVVGAHYTGSRRLDFGGGHSVKVHDFLIAHLCGECHEYMDRLSRDKDNRWEHSEEFLYLVALTWERLFLQGTIVVARKGEVEALALEEARPGDVPPSVCHVEAQG